MRDSDILEIGTLFVAALRLRREGDVRIRSDMDVFTKATVQLALKKNATAAKVYVYQGVMGLRTNDFDQMLSMLTAARQIAWLSPGFTHFVFEISPAFAKRVLEKADPERRADVEALADEYLKGITA